MDRFKELDPVALGRAGYNAFRRRTLGLRLVDYQLPPWEDMSDSLRISWIHSAEIVQAHVQDRESLRWAALRLAAEGRNRTAAGTLVRIKALHTQGQHGGGITSGYCVECETKWPCETIRLIEEVGKTVSEVSEGDAIQSGESQG